MARVQYFACGCGPYTTQNAKHSTVHCTLRPSSVQQKDSVLTVPVCGPYTSHTVECTVRCPKIHSVRTYDSARHINKSTNESHSRRKFNTPRNRHINFFKSTLFFLARLLHGSLTFSSTAACTRTTPTRTRRLLTAGNCCGGHRGFCFGRCRGCGHLTSCGGYFFCGRGLGVLVGAGFGGG